MAESVDHPGVLRGSTLPLGTRAGTEPHSWYDADASAHVLRVGPNYKKHGKKAPSAESLYECVGVEIVANDRVIPDIASQLEFAPRGRRHAKLRPRNR